MRSGNEVAIFVARHGRSEILVVHRSPAQGGYWHTIAGGIEPGEQPEEAAQRELLEETGLSISVLSAAGEAVQFAYSLDEDPPERQALYEPNVAEVKVDCYLVDAPDGWEPSLDWEHDGYRWVTAGEAPDALHWPDTAAALRRLLAPAS